MCHIKTLIDLKKSVYIYKKTWYSYLKMIQNIFRIMMQMLLNAQKYK